MERFYFFFLSDLHVPICEGRDKDRSSIRLAHYHDKVQNEDEVEIYLMFPAYHNQNYLPSRWFVQALQYRFL